MSDQPGSPDKGLAGQLTKAMALMGTAQSVNILIAIARGKIIALLLGPAGIGLLGLLYSVLSTAVAVFGLGLKNSAVRSIAATENEQEISSISTTLMVACFIQGLLSLLCVWLLAEQISVWISGVVSYAQEIRLIGIATIFSLTAGSQIAILQGLRKIADLARITVIASFVATTVGLLIVAMTGLQGIVWLVVIEPATAALVAWVFCRRLPMSFSKPSVPLMWNHWHPMASLGVVLMLGAVSTTATLLIVRSIITHQLGLDAAGEFSAAWGITIQYIGFLLTAMTTDYFPRLSSTMNDSTAMNQLVNTQLQLCLALGGPILILMIGAAPWVVLLLYSAEFIEAIVLLQWQSLGNIFKIAAWPVAFIFMAAAHKKTFFITELGWNLAFICLVWFWLPTLGLEITGIGFFFCYVIYFMLVCFITRRSAQFSLDKKSLQLLSLNFLLAPLALAVSLNNALVGACLCTALATASFVVGARVCEFPSFRQLISR